ncbi:MAG: glycosyltransferase [Anaerolineae bacterium]|nr:glycosyltransferase [Anaerolineae bacterium]
MAPLFSVVIPAYNQAEYLKEAIQSVLGQSLQDFEVVVVNDGSTDHTETIVRGFSDTRIRYLCHPVNRGLPAARNTGICSAVGRNIALLDSDDTYTPDKLEVHANYLAEHPGIHITYNARYELLPGGKQIGGLYRPKPVVELSDLVMGFPFSPSDMVFRRECIDQAGVFDESLINGAEDLDFPCRLALAGRRFASVDRVLNYRRYNIRKSRRSMEKRKQEYEMVLNRVFQDPRCPEGVRAMRNLALARHTVELAFVSLANEDSSLGQEFLKEVVEYDPAIAAGQPAPIMSGLVRWGVHHTTTDHAAVIVKIINQFPDVFQFLSSQSAWVIAQVCLQKLMRAVIWDDPEAVQELLPLAQEGNARIDDTVLRQLQHQLIDIDELLGEVSCGQSLKRLEPMFEVLGSQSQQRALDARIRVTRAFRMYHLSDYQCVLVNILNAFWKQPAICWDRGVASITARSVVRQAIAAVDKSNTGIEGNCV